MLSMKEVAVDLVNEGYAFVPPHIHKIHTNLITNASEASTRLINKLAKLKRDGFTTNFTRPGEQEAEIGVVRRTPKDGRDIKYFLHVSHDVLDFFYRDVPLHHRLVMMNEWGPLVADLETLTNLQSDLNFLNMRLLKEVCPLVPGWENRTSEILDSYQRSCSESLRYSTTTLRGLLYSAQDGHAGARGHHDRSFITNHLGDFGGDLLAHVDMESSEGRLVSPKAGHILIFWGLKAFILSEGFLVPLWHSATARSDEDRRALVNFAHVDTEIPLTYAKDAFPVYCKKFGITDPRVWYARKLGFEFLDV